jgi:uncharacterized membrane protein
MIGEEYGWVALDGLTILWLILQMVLIVLIPGFLLSLAVFPNKKTIAMSERLGLSIGLGLLPPFLLALLNISIGVRINFVTSLMFFVLVSILSLLLFINRGGNLNLFDWYTSKEALDSE